MTNTKKKSKKTSRTAYLGLLFHEFAKRSAEICGYPIVFILAIVTVIIWLLCGFFFKFSDTWQLVINTITNIVEFLILFLIQNTQNRDSKSIHIKLDELIIANKPARKSIIDLDRLTDEQLKSLEKQYTKISDQKKLEP